MLGKISYETLKAVAVYGACLSATGCAVFYYLIQRNLASSQYYTKSLDALNGHAQAKYLLGEPIRSKYLKLADSRNHITTRHAQVVIPVTGTRTAGHILTSASHRQGQWQLDSVVLQFKGRPESLVLVEDTQPNISSNLSQPL